jgi:hypothetical protein
VFLVRIGADAYMFLRFLRMAFRVWLGKGSMYWEGGGSELPQKGFSALGEGKDPTAWGIGAGFLRMGVCG